MDTLDPEEDRYHVAASASLTAAGARVLKEGDTFALVNRFGDVHRAGGNEQGLYHRGTRYLSRLELRIAGKRPLFLSSGMLDDNLVLAVALSNPDLTADGGEELISYGTLHVSRFILLRQGSCVQRIRVTNHGDSPVTAPLELHFGADFVDVFEVRGTSRPGRGELRPAFVSGSRVVASYRGLDGVVRRTCIELSPEPRSLSASEAQYRLRLDSKQTIVLELTVSCECGEDVLSQLPRFDDALSHASARSRQRIEQECGVRTTNEAFNAWLERSRADLHMLTADTPHGPYPYAGVPWFSTPFGRDGIWTALSALWLSPEYGAGVLRFLSATQSRVTDDLNDAEPGKIVHELRDGEMAELREIPFGRYYGSIDSTPLYLMLAAQYYRTTGDVELIQQIWPNLLAASEWLERYGDSDGDGFVEYGRRSRDGLVQQGWKDSNDSVFHADGTLAHGPIALCEVQGYAYAARVGMAELALAMREPELGARFDKDARDLCARFDEAFWCDHLGTYALALDGSKRRCEVRSSNAAHCLYTGIALPERAAVLRRQLLSEDMFSGWGVRTLSTRERRYNPMSYHNGSIWPHDNAIAAEGLAAYGYREEALAILDALYGVSSKVELNRLPELFCGFERLPGQGPTLYPVACSPQAWAAASVFMLLKAALGLSLDARQGRVTLRTPRLPPFIDELWLSSLRVGEGSVDLRLQRYDGDVGVNALKKRGDVSVVTVR